MKNIEDIQYTIIDIQEYFLRPIEIIVEKWNISKAIRHILIQYFKLKCIDMR